MLDKKTNAIACLRFGDQHGSIPGASTKKTIDQNKAPMRDTPDRIKQFVAGHRAAAAKQRELMAAEGPNPEQAIAECLSALAVLEAKGLWPRGPRDPVNEREVLRVRELWAKTKREYRSGGNR